MWYFLWGNTWLSCSRDEAREMLRDGYEIKYECDGTEIGRLLPKAA
jgi:hypothetical protein